MRYQLRAACASAAALIAVLSAGCHPRLNSNETADVVPQASQTGADTLHGVVMVTGIDPAPQINIRQANGSLVQLSGPVAAAIARLSGADLWVAGTRGQNRFIAQRFIVRSVDGAPVLDGILELRAGNLWIVPVNAAPQAVVNPPAALRGQVGARVWIAGDVSRGVSSYGIIQPR